MPADQIVKEILTRERELIGEQKERIMQYIGYDQLGVSPSDSID